MTWQPQPWQQPWQQPTPYPPGAYGPAPYPTRPRPPVLRWVAAGVVFALLLTAGFVVHRTVLSQFVGGAWSPEDAVRQVVAALESGDTTKIGLLIPPDEVAGLSEVTAEYDRILAEIGDDGADTSMLQSTDAYAVDVENLELESAVEQHDLTKVSIVNADITVSWNPDELPDQLRDRYFPQGTEADDATIEIRGDDITVDGEEQPLTVDGEEVAPFVMTVQRDGAWYVSPIFTTLQYLSENEGYTTSPAPTSPGADSPTEAARAFVDGLADTLASEDVTSLADTLAGVEGKALLTYQDMLNSDFDTGGSDELTVDEAEFDVLSVDGTTARVKPTSFRLTWEDGQEVQWDGQCLSVKATGDSEKYCTDDEDTLGPFAPLVDRLGYLVAVRSDGGWKISISRTVFTMMADVLSWVGDNEMPLLRWLMSDDPTELTDNVDAAASIEVGDSATVEVEAIGPYVDAGYVVVDIEYSGSDPFSVYCESDSIGCEVAALISPSGELESPYFGGDDGDGTYKAVVMATVGDVEVFAEDW